MLLVSSAVVDVVRSAVIVDEVVARVEVSALPDAIPASVVSSDPSPDIVCPAGSDSCDDDDPGTILVTPDNVVSSSVHDFVPSAANVIEVSAVDVDVCASESVLLGSATVALVKGTVVVDDDIAGRVEIVASSDVVEAVLVLGIS